MSKRLQKYGLFRIVRAHSVLICSTHSHADCGPGKASPLGKLSARTVKNLKEPGTNSDGEVPFRRHMPPPNWGADPQNSQDLQFALDQIRLNGSSIRFSAASDAMLRSGTEIARISDTTLACGFGELLHFFRAFKKRFGVPPTGLRRSWLQRPLASRRAN